MESAVILNLDDLVSPSWELVNRASEAMFSPNLKTPFVRYLNHREGRSLVTEMRYFANWKTCEQTL
jgi:hypothetical protein